MKTSIVKALGPRASLAYQERHLVHWVGDECRLPRGLVDAALVELGNHLDSEIALAEIPVFAPGVQTSLALRAR